MLLGLHGHFEDSLVASGKPVTCLIIMTLGTRIETTHLFPLLSYAVEARAGHHRRVEFSPMTTKLFENSQLTDITILLNNFKCSNQQLFLCIKQFHCLLTLVLL